MKTCIVAFSAFCISLTSASSSPERMLKLEIRQGEDIRETLEVRYRTGEAHKQSSLEAVNHFLRDRRTGKTGEIDPRLLDVLWDISSAVEAKGRPITIIRSYGNLTKRRKSGELVAAPKSLHTKGRAIDFKIDGVPVKKLRDAAIALKVGGVGYYPDAFLHIDLGKVRYWPRTKN